MRLSWLLLLEGFRLDSSQLFRCRNIWSVVEMFLKGRSEIRCYKWCHSTPV